MNSQALQLKPWSKETFLKNISLFAISRDDSLRYIQKMLTFSIKKINFPRDCYYPFFLLYQQRLSSLIKWVHFRWGNSNTSVDFILSSFRRCTLKSRGKQTMFHTPPYQMPATFRIKRTFSSLGKKGGLSNRWRCATLMMKLSFEFPPRKRIVAHSVRLYVCNFLDLLSLPIDLFGLSNKCNPWNPPK